MKHESNETRQILGRGVYSTSEAVRLVNFHRAEFERSHSISNQTIARWLQGYDYRVHGEIHHSAPLWMPDYSNDNALLEISFRDLIELRFVKAFRALGLGLPTIRACFTRAVEEVQDERPFSTRRFRTDGRTIFLEITNGNSEGHLIDLKHRQNVFRRIVAPSLKDLEFDAEAVSRWFPLGIKKRSIVVDPARAFGRPIVTEGGVPTVIIADAMEIEGSPEKVAKLYDIPISAVRDAAAFEKQLAA